MVTPRPMRQKRRVASDSTNRLTVSLAPGQREALEAVAQQNHVKLAFVVRYALAEFIRQHRDKQIRLEFPKL